MRHPDELPDPTKVDKVALERIAALPDFSDTFHLRELPEVTGVERHHMERISLLTDGGPVSQQKDPLGDYQRPDVARPVSEIPPITDFLDGTPINIRRVMPMGDQHVSLPLGLQWTQEALIELSGDEVHEFIERWEAAHKQVLPPKLLQLDPGEHARQQYFPDVEYGVLPADTEWLSVAKTHVPDAVKEYIHLLETGETKTWCKCPWIVHPDDVNLAEGECGYCGYSQENDRHGVGLITNSEELDAGRHRFQGRRIRRDHNNQSPDCPVHTKEGLVLGFFEHLFRDSDEAAPTSGT